MSWFGFQPPPPPPNPARASGLLTPPPPLAATDPKLLRRRMDAYKAEGFTDTQAFALVLASVRGKA